MKDLLLCVHVVVKTLNLEISARCHLPIVRKGVPRVQHGYFILIQPIRSLFSSLPLRPPCSLLSRRFMLAIAKCILTIPKLDRYQQFGDKKKC